MLTATTALAQVPRDTLYLDELQRAAEQADPRGIQLGLLSRQSASRLETLRRERLPAVGVTGTAQYVSDVVSVGALMPSLTVPAPPHDQYDLYLTVRQPLIDPTRAGRAAVERAGEAESAARVRTALWQQRVAVNEAFFGALLRSSQLSSLDAAIGDLDARLTMARTRVSAGAALPSEALLLETELLRRRQARDEIVSERNAAREVLGLLTGRSIVSTVVLASRVAAGGASAGTTDTPGRDRPEFAQFDRARATLDARRAATSAQDLPRLSVFGRTGYGRPGLNALNRAFDAYFLAGLQVEWSPWTWGRTRRELEVQALQAELIGADERAFRDALRRAGVTQRAQIGALAGGLAADDSIVALRAQILRETRVRHDEGEVSAADYIARLTEHLSAQLDRDARRVRLEEARARYLTTMGLEVR
ncbi:MAG: TolC family protein [Gemmatimonadaceae bacterium]|nr:TolC family protein [Gemmatimonadaceae bacterium]